VAAATLQIRIMAQLTEGRLASGSVNYLDDGGSDEAQEPVRRVTADDPTRIGDAPNERQRPAPSPTTHR